jgi:hypothetical protein
MPLDETDIDTCFDEEGCRRMPQHVRGYPTHNSGFFRYASQPQSHRLRPHWRPMTVCKERTGADLCRSTVLYDPKQVLSQRRVSNISDAITRAFSLNSDTGAVRR